MELFTSSGVTLDSIGKSTVRAEEEEKEEEERRRRRRRRRGEGGGGEEEEEVVCRARREVLPYRCYKTALCSLAFYAVMLCMSCVLFCVHCWEEILTYPFSLSHRSPREPQRGRCSFFR